MGRQTLFRVRKSICGPPKLWEGKTCVKRPKENKTWSSRGWNQIWHDLKGHIKDLVSNIRAKKSWWRILRRVREESITWSDRENYCGCYVEERICRRTRGNIGRPLRRFLCNTLYIVSPPKIKLIIIIHKYKPEWYNLTLVPWIKSRHFWICFQHSTYYLWPSHCSSQIILFNNLTFYCFFLDILFHYNDLTIPWTQLIHFCSKPQFMPISMLFPILCQKLFSSLPKLW